MHEHFLFIPVKRYITTYMHACMKGNAYEAYGYWFISDVTAYTYERISYVLRVFFFYVCVDKVYEFIIFKQVSIKFYMKNMRKMIMIAVFGL